MQFKEVNDKEHIQVFPLWSFHMFLNSRALQQLCIKSAFSLNISIFPKCGDYSLRLFSLPCPSPSFNRFNSNMCPVFLPSMWGLKAGLPGFACHGCSLHPGAGCQKW